MKNPTRNVKWSAEKQNFTATEFNDHHIYKRGLSDGFVRVVNLN